MITIDEKDLQNIAKSMAPTLRKYVRHSNGIVTEKGIEEIILAGLEGYYEGKTQKDKEDWKKYPLYKQEVQ